jgi:hypothetical protein
MQRRIKPDYQTVVAHTVTLECLAQWDGWQFLLQEISVKGLSLYIRHEGKTGTPAHFHITYIREKAQKSTRKSNQGDILQ